MQPQQLFAELIQALFVNGPDSPQVQRVLQDVQTHNEKLLPQAQATVNAFGMSQGAAPRANAATATLGGGFSLQTLIAAVIGAAGLTGGSAWVAATSSLNKISELLKPIPIPFEAHDRLTLMVYVAATGALAGLAQSFYYNNWTLILPTFSRQNTQFKIANLGCLRNIWVGMLTALATTWMASSAMTTPSTGAPTASPVVAPAPGATPAKPAAEGVSKTTNDMPNGDSAFAGGQPKAATGSPSGGGTENKSAEKDLKTASSSIGVGGPKEPENLLSWMVLLSSAVAGYLGSRMSSNVVDKTMLVEALPQSAANPASPAVAAAIRDSKTVADKVATAVGVPLPNVPSPPGIDLVRQELQAQKDALAFLDTQALRSNLGSLGKPLVADGVGLSVETLLIVQALKQPIRELLRRFDVSSVASFPTSDAFLAALDESGIDVTSAQLRKTLSETHGKCVELKALLAKLPSDWTLTAEKLGAA